MSLFDRLRKKKTSSAQMLIGAEHIAERSIRTRDGQHIVYFLVEPVNLAVLSRSVIHQRITELMNTLKALETAELLCLGSREDFDENKRALKARLADEDCEPVRRLLEKDLAFLDRIQIQTASAREFAIALRFTDEDEIAPQISRTEKLLKEQKFRARVAERDDLKRLFAVYFAQNLTQLVTDDYDGERWIDS